MHENDVICIEEQLQSSIAEVDRSSLRQKPSSVRTPSMLMPNTQVTIKIDKVLEPLPMKS